MGIGHNASTAIHWSHAPKHLSTRHSPGQEALRHWEVECWEVAPRNPTAPELENGHSSDSSRKPWLCITTESKTACSFSAVAGGRSGELREQLTIFSGCSVHSHSLEEGAWHSSMSEVSEWGAEMARQVKALALSLITGTHVVDSRTHSHKLWLPYTL